MADIKVDASNFPYFGYYFGHKKFNTLLKMPSVLLTESESIDLESQVNWPEDLILYQPLQMTQILLPDNATCLAVTCYCKMVGVPIRIEERSNAEFMSPTGRLPLVRCGSYLMTDLERVANFLRDKTQRGNLDDLDATEKADMRSYMSLINNKLHIAELYIVWFHNVTYHTATAKRYGSVFPWPLNLILPWSKRREICNKLKVFQWAKKSLDEVIYEVDQVCQALSLRLLDRTWFFGNRPTELDALVFGHLFTILTTKLSSDIFINIINKYSNLTEFCKRIERDFF